ncbi:hypothetical protein [Alteriqipengyuania sp. 357]
MRVLPYFVGAAIVVAIGGAVAGAAIDTTPRKIHDSPTMPAGSGIDFGQAGKPQTLTANHYPLEANGSTIDVAELRERGLYSQDRYASSYYVEDPDDAFDFDAAAADQRQWEAEQARAVAQRVRDRQQRSAARQPLKLERPARVADSQVEFVSRPVVQDTSAMVR